jgi:hypothetical protein
MPYVTGMTTEKASTPIAGTATLRISSVAYATEERLSLAKTASAVGLPSRSCFSCAVGSAGPSTSRFHTCPRPRRSGVRLRGGDVACAATGSGC